jgi:ParB-like chromosome segregation protein Spo0J
MAVAKAAKKRTIKKPEPKTKPPATVQGKVVMNSLFDSADTLLIRSLQPHPENYNVGDIDSIAKSLNKYGQYKPIVVQQGTRVICAGNHTWLAARQLGWTHIKAVVLDINDEDAKEILVADNQLARLGNYDDDKLDALVMSIKDKSALGFSEQQQEEMKTRLAKRAAEVQERIKQQAEWNKQLQQSKTFTGSALGEEPDPDDDDEDQGTYVNLGSLEDGTAESRKTKQPDALLDAEEEIPGALTLKEPNISNYDGAGYWGITKFDPSMLMTFDELPKKLESWAGSATKDWPDPDVWWLYNFGVDSTSGMRDPSKMILASYTYDSYFENFFWWAEKFAAKFINTGIKYAITPDYSMESDQPRALALYQLIRSRYIGRYWQDVGIKIIPNISWIDGDLEFLTKYVLGTLPKRMPMIAVQMQTIDPKEVKGGIDHYVKQVQTVFDVLQPQGALIYASKMGRDLFNRRITVDCPVRLLGTRQEKLSAQAKKRSKIKKGKL